MDLIQDRPALLAFAALLALALLWREREQEMARPPQSWLWMLVGGHIALAIGFANVAQHPLASPLLIGLGSGVVAACVCSVLGGGWSGSSLLAMVAAQIPALALTGTANLVVGSAAAAAGIAAGGWLFGRLDSAGPAALFALLAGSAEALGSVQIGGVHAAPAAIITVALGLAMISLSAANGAAWALPVAAVVAGSALLLVGWRLFQALEIGLVALVAAVVAALLAWALPADSPDAPRPFVALFGAILMVAVGTVAFAEARGLGMAFAAMAVLAVSAITQRGTLAALASPLAALAIYRGFSVAYPDAARSLDIGQHYGLIGFLGGLLAALAVADLAGRSEAKAGFFAALAAVASCFAAPLLLGAKGSVGLITGIGFAPALALLLLGGAVRAWGVSAVFMGATICGYAFFRDQMALTRAEKLPVLAVIGLFALACGVVATIITRPKSERPEASA